VPQIRKIKLNLMFRNPPNYRNQQTWNINMSEHLKEEISQGSTVLMTLSQLSSQISNIFSTQNKFFGPQSQKLENNLLVIILL
jgi:hypothetical protein